MEKFFENLSNLIYAEMNRMNCTQIYFADRCGINRNELSNILNLRIKNITVKTIFKICNNTNISIENVFLIGNNFFDKELKDYILTNGKEQYHFVKTK